MATSKSGLFETHSIAPMVAGVSAGVISTSLLLPLDVIKVRMLPENLGPLIRTLIQRQFHRGSCRLTLIFRRAQGKIASQ